MSFSVIPWSYSSMTAFETCPRRYYLTKVTKDVSDPPGEAALHGTMVHKAIEDYLNGTAEFPDKYGQYRRTVDAVKAACGVLSVEHKFALTRGFKPTDFFGKDAWVRGVFDVHVVSGANATVLDWKLGKIKEDHEQLKLFAAATFATAPEVQSVKTGYVWLAHNKVTKQTFDREEAPGIWQEYLPRVRRLEKAQETGNFPPKPSGLCKAWCPCTRAHCEFSGRLK